MLLEEGNLDDAAREMASLNGWAGRLSSDWLSEARKVLEVRQALDVSSSFFACLGKTSLTRYRSLQPRLDLKA